MATLIFQFLLLSSLLWFLCYIILLYSFETSKKECLTKSLIYTLFFIAIVLLFGSLAFPEWYIQDKKITDIAEKGLLGDSFGGLSNPIVAISGVIITGLAFYAQYRANEDVRNQFKFQQFDNHVYKLADIYRDNIVRWKKLDKKLNLVFEDRLVAISILETYNILLDEMSQFINYWKESKKENDIISISYKNELTKLLLDYNESLSVELKDIIEKTVKSEITYLVLFFGVEDRGRVNIILHCESKYNSTFIMDMTNYFSYKVSIIDQESPDKSAKLHVFKIQKQPQDFNNWPYTFLSIITENENLVTANMKEPLKDVVFPHKYYNGCETILAHHFRNLHSTYKYINDFNSIDYQKRWKVHAKLIRTQSTNAEQILFFLNSICLLGREWELKHVTSRSNPDVVLINKRLVTKYDIIKNIPQGDRRKYNIELYYPDIEWEDRPMTSENKEDRAMYYYRQRFEDKFYD